MAIAIKKQTLSKKEQEAKQRLLGKEQQSKQTIPSQKNYSPPTKDVSQPFKQAYNAPSNEQVDQFLKEVEGDFKQIAQKQVTMGMLTTQQELIKQQNEMVLKNQQQLQQFLTQPTQQQQYQQQPSAQQQQFLALLQPINQQLNEIKSLYQQTRASTQELQLQMKQGGGVGQQEVQECKEQNEKLKTLLDTTQNNLLYVQPENLRALQNFTEFNLRLYQDTVQNLQGQICALQNEAMTTEQELNVKYKQLSDARLNQKINQHKQYEEDVLRQITEKVNGIDYDQTRQWMHKKLGGEYDYHEIVDEVGQVVDTINNIIQDYQFAGKEFEMNIPELQLTQAEIDILNAKPISILDELKQQYGITSKPKYQQQQQTQSLPIQIPKPNKPVHLQAIQSQPKEAPKDIKFEKVRTTQQYEPILQERESEKKAKAKKQEIKRNEIKQEKLKYRELSKEKDRQRQQSVKKQKDQEQSKNYGMIQYLDEDESFQQQSKAEIAYVKPQISQIIQHKEDDQFRNHQQQQHQQQQQSIIKKENEQFETQIPNTQLRDAYQHQQLRDQYQELPIDPQFVDYAKLVNQIGNNVYGSEEQKSSALLNKLGIKQEQPKNEYDLLELISKDIIKQKLQMEQTKKLAVNEYERKQQDVIKKNQSIQIQPEQPSIQDQVAQGAQAFFQGLLQAFNTTLTQVNNTIQKPPAQQQQQQYQYEYEESEYSEEPSEELKKPFQGTQTLQQYTFAQTFQPPQKKEQTVDLKEYYKKFEIESQNSQLSQNISGSYGGSIFKVNEDEKSEGQISIASVNKQKNLTKDIFKGLDEDLSDGEIQIYTTKQK